MRRNSNSNASASRKMEESLSSLPNLKAIHDEADENSTYTTPSDMTAIQGGHAPDEEVIMRMLGLPEDAEHVNALHCFVRSTYIQVFSATSWICNNAQKGRKNKLHPGRVGLRCTFCAHVKDPSVRENNSSIYPKCVEDIYMAVTTMQRVHLTTCKFVPLDLKDKYIELKLNDRSRGRKE